MDLNRYEVTYSPDCIGQLQLNDKRTSSCREFERFRRLSYRRDARSSSCREQSVHGSCLRCEQGENRGFSDADHGRLGNVVHKYGASSHSRIGNASTVVGTFLVDATDCGSGNLEIAISINEKNIPNYVQNEGGARFRVKFIPIQVGNHYVQIKFNGKDIQGKALIRRRFS